MTTELTIDPEFADLLPQLSTEENAQLEKKLLAEGCQEKLIVWEEKGILLDGHNRRLICEKHSIPFEVRRVSLPSRNHALQWIVDHQLGRRNLTNERRAYYIGKDYLLEKQSVGRPEKLGHSDLISGPTVGKVAEKHGVSEKTVQRDAEFAEALDKATPKAREQVLNGQAGVTKKAVIEGTQLLCERCQRVAPGKGIPRCAACEETRDAAARQRILDNKRAPTPASVPAAKGFDWDTFTFDYKALEAQVTKLAAKFEAEAAPEILKLQKKLESWKRNFRQCHDHLANGDQPAITVQQQDGMFGPDGKPPKAPKAKRPNPLFDAIAEVTCLDPMTAGSQIGKAAAILQAADPPYTPEEVKQLPAAIKARGMKFTITPRAVAKYIGYVRDNAANNKPAEPLNEKLQRQARQRAEANGVPANH